MISPPLSDNQRKAVDFALDTPGNAWFMPPGMGKTRSWLEVIAETAGRVLVVAPKLVCMDTWPRENVKWGHKYPMRFLHGKNKHLRGDERVSLINYESLPWLAETLGDASKPRYEMVIFDEMSKMKNPLSQRFSAWKKISRQFRFSSGGTGTPVGAHLYDLFGEMYVCDRGLSLGDNYNRFLRRYFSENEYTRELTPYHDAESEILAAIAPRALSFDIDDLDMPPLTHVPHLVDIPKDARDYYNQMHADSVVDDLDLYAPTAAVRSIKLRQMASGSVLSTTGEGNKLHAAKSEHLRSILDDNSGRPVMVFFEFLSDYQAICEVAGYEVPALYGRTTANAAAQAVRDWNAGRLPLFALHPRSAAYGLNLQDSGNVVVWYTVPWSYEMLNQGTARLWRQGQKHNVTSHYLLIEATIDEQVYARVGERADTHARVMRALL